MTLPPSVKFGQLVVVVFLELVVVVFLGSCVGGPVTSGLNCCADDRQSKPPPPPQKEERVHLQGVLVEGGAECQRFRSSDGKYYTLEGGPDGFHTGDTVEVTGTVLQVSHCMQDTTIHVETSRRASQAG